MATSKVKAENRTQVLKMIWQNPNISRLELASRLELDKSTISNIVSSLLEMGLVRVASEMPSGPSGGRKVSQLTINKGFGQVLGLDLRRDKYLITLLDLSGAVQFQKKVDFDVYKHDLSELMMKILDKEVAELQINGFSLMGIGVGMGGLIDSDKNTVLLSYPFSVKSPLELGPLLSARFKIPFFLENDANCGAWGELIKTRQEGLKEFLFILWESMHTDKVYLKNSVGFGIVMDGCVRQGESNYAGEFRSVLQTEREYGQFCGTHLQENKNAPDFELRLSIVKELSMNLGMIINLLDMKNVFIGGDVGDVMDEMKDLFQKSIEWYWPYGHKREINIRFSDSGEYVISYGAAGMVLEKLFSSLDVLNSSLVSVSGGKSLLM